MKKFFKPFIIAAFIFSSACGFADYVDLKPLVEYLKTVEPQQTLENFAQADGKKFVQDDMNEIPSQKLNELDQTAKKISLKYKCGVYCYLANDIYSYKGYLKSKQIPHKTDDIDEIICNVDQIPETGTPTEDVWVFSDVCFLNENLGYPGTRDTILLVIDGVNRVYDVFVYGDFGNKTFNEYGRERLANHFTEKIESGRNDWQGAIEVFLNDLPEYFEASLKNEPIKEPKAWLFIISATIIVSVVIGLTAAFYEKSKLKSISPASEAENYIPDGAVNFTKRSDIFTHSTEVRHETASSSGGSSSSSGGSSHSSGSF